MRDPRSFRSGAAPRARAYPLAPSTILTLALSRADAPLAPSPTPSPAAAGEGRALTPTLACVAGEGGELSEPGEGYLHAEQSLATLAPISALPGASAT